MIGALPIEIEVATYASALLAAALAFVFARNRGRQTWPWAVAAFLFVAPVIIVLQRRSESASPRPTRWWPHLLLAGGLLAACVVLGAMPLRSDRIASLEAHVLATWFSDHTLLAEGPTLHAPAAKLGLTGNPKRPLVLGLLGAALGALVLHRTSLSLTLLGLMGAVLGAGAWFAALTSATAHWLEHPLESPQIPTEHLVVAFGLLLWVSIGWAWLSQRSRRAA